MEWEENYIKRLLFFLSKPQSLILDAGCGDGRHTILIEKNGGRAIGIDLSENMLKEAKSLYPDGDFRKMDMRKLLFDSDSFDGIWASGSIYHVPKSDMRKVIKEFRRVSRVGGIVALSFKLGIGEGMEANPKSYSGSPRYFAYYIRGEMKELFGRFGFDELESCTYPEEIFGDNNQQMWFRRSV
ncbi:MAG: class I SAM-dependent methyltransferase [Chloroflexi bacterium]|nr:class I SAM-dependent methyltransferase [Chloroflexota bacterium]